jgi:hypothetical protein
VAFFISKGYLMKNGYGLLEAAPEMPSASENLKNTENAIKNWNLGPENVDLHNKPYWQKMAKLWLVDEKTARTRICGNCEYYDNTPESLQAMKDKYPLNKYDIYDSYTQRGWCHKLDFACHTPRSCQAWERKDFESEED